MKNKILTAIFNHCGIARKKTGEILTGSIRNKILIASLVIIIFPLIITGFIAEGFISSRAESIYFGRMNAELAHVNNLISEKIVNAKMDLELLCSMRAFRKIDPSSFNIYYNKSGPVDLSRVKHPPAEKEIYLFMKLMGEKHPDYVEIYAGTKYGGFVSSGDYILKTPYDPRIRPWYSDAAAGAGKSVVARSYLSVTGDYVTAVVKAEGFANGTPLFAAGIDLSLNRLSEIISSIKIGATGYLVLIERDGVILAHPRKPELNSKNIMELGIPEMSTLLTEESCVLNYSFENTEKTAKVITSQQTGWKLMAVIERSEIKRSASYFRTVIIATILVITLFCSMLYIYIIRGIVRPVKRLAAFGRSIAAGNLEEPLLLRRSDELGRLADDFNDMMYKLRESIDSIRGIIDMMPSIIIQMDEHGRIIEWNREAQKFIRIPLKDAKGMNFSDVKPEIASYLLNLNSVVASEKPVSFYRIKIAGLDENFFNLFIFLLKTEHSLNIILRMDDITEFEKKDEQIRHIQKMESIGLLASGIAHDFNNILGGMLATVSLLKHRILKGKITEASGIFKDLEVVEKSCETGAEITSQLLDISRKETDLELHKADLNDTVNQIIKICRKSFDRSLRISFLPYKEKAFAMINPVQLHQSLLNLFINSSHAMTIMRKDGEQQGGYLEAGILKVNADSIFINKHYGAREGNYWQIYIKDTGVGMDKRTLSRVFEPFFTTKTGTEIKGTGLGLSIVYSIIKNHGGFIDVYSEPGLGTKFTVNIPIPDNISDSADSSGRPEICGGEGTILLIDDEETIRLYTGEMLSECGYSVLEASNGAEGIELFIRHRDSIRAVIIDMVMPVKSGFETLSDMIKIDPDVRILMTSGLKSREVIDSVLNAGAKDFIEKPYSIDQLAEKIHSILL